MIFKTRLNGKNKIKYLTRLFSLGNHTLIRIPIRNTFYNTFGVIIFSHWMEIYKTDDDEMSPSYGWGKKT